MKDYDVLRSGPLGFGEDFSVFSSPVRKYRMSYCSHPGFGIGVGIGVAQMLKFLVKVFLYLLEVVDGSS